MMVPRAVRVVKQGIPHERTPEIKIVVFDILKPSASEVGDAYKCRDGVRKWIQFLDTWENGILGSVV